MRIRFILLAALSLPFFWSCDEDLSADDVPQVYLVEFEEITPEEPVPVETIQEYWNNQHLTEIAGMAKYSIRLFKLVYKTSFEGSSLQVSGLVATPVALEKNDRFPVMSFQHPAITQKALCPTANPDAKSNRLVSYLASLGMVVLMPDYIGFGSSGTVFHPYMCKEYSVDAVVDFIRASREFLFNQDPCEINEKLFLAGYSEGAFISLATLHALESGAADAGTPVLATACGSGLYDLNKFRDWMVNQPKYDQPYIIAHILESYSAYLGLNIDYSLVFTEQIAAAVPGMFDQDRTIAEHNDMLEGILGTLHIGEMYNDDFENVLQFHSEEPYAQLRQLLEDNSVKTWNLNSDLTLYYGKNDNWVPNDLSLELYRQFRLEGATEKVKVDMIDGVDHESAFVPIIIKAIQRFKQY